MVKIKTYSGLDYLCISAIVFHHNNQLISFITIDNESIEIYYSDIIGISVLNTTESIIKNIKNQ